MKEMEVLNNVKIRKAAVLKEDDKLNNDYAVLFL